MIWLTWHRTPTDVAAARRSGGLGVVVSLAGFAVGAWSAGFAGEPAAGRLAHIDIAHGDRWSGTTGIGVDRNVPSARRVS
ncbi:MAG: hypothetical protein GEV28_23780 [Actinophytocola sp.]|uniref:hypothetical protein n=1 Tax=Actinophytocola sp. TaxID=1872138 RepID=UPI0013237DC3|nr:hypothetical protein [Actinophytocola sp.]MPZ83246.1 hypothetical protein [Actinophytocola sp.]